MRFKAQLAPLALLFSLLAACGGHIDASTDPGGTGGAACPAPNPGMCAPSGCLNGVKRTGQAACKDGVWSCLEASCDAKPPACDGTPFSYCSSSGQITQACCPAAADCAAPASYCDLGGGACLVGQACAIGDTDAGTIVVDASTCAAGEILASSYSQSCAADADCTPVYEGPLCGNCFCPNGVIAQSALATYRHDFAQAKAGVNACDCSMIQAPACRAGMCVFP